MKAKTGSSAAPPIHVKRGSVTVSRSDAMGTRTQIVGNSRLDSLDVAVGAQDAEEPLT